MSDKITEARKPYHGAYPGDKCPECGEPPKAACRCVLNDRWCINRHYWRREKGTGAALLVESGHGPVVKRYDVVEAKSMPDLTKLIGKVVKAKRLGWQGPSPDGEPNPDLNWPDFVAFDVEGVYSQREVEADPALGRPAYTQHLVGFKLVDPDTVVPN